MTDDQERISAILADIARFAVTARRVVERGHDRFADPGDDDQRRIARSLVVDLSAAADRLPESFRQAHPGIDWRGVRAVRNFIAHDYDGTDEEILWQAIVVQFPAIIGALGTPTTPKASFKGGDMDPYYRLVERVRELLEAEGRSDASRELWEAERAAATSGEAIAGLGAVLKRVLEQRLADATRRAVVEALSHGERLWNEVNS